MFISPRTFQTLAALFFCGLVSLLAFQSAACAESSTFETSWTGRARACAGGLPDSLHTASLRLRVRHQNKPLASQTLRFELRDAQGAMFVGSSGQLQPTITATTNATGETSVQVRGGRHVSSPRLLAMSENEVIGETQLDFGGAIFYRRVPDPDWPTEDSDGGWMTTPQQTGKIFLKFKRDANKGDLPDNWIPVAGHKVRIRFIVTLNGGQRLSELKDTQKHIWLTQHKKKVAFLDLTTGSDGTAWFRYGASPDEFGYELEMENLTQEGEDAPPPSAEIPLPPVARTAWQEVLSDKTDTSAPRFTRFQAPPGINARLAWTSTLAPTLGAFNGGVTLHITDILPYSKAVAERSYDLAIANIYESYPLRFIGKGDSVLIGGGVLSPELEKQLDAQRRIPSQEEGAGNPLRLPQALYRFDTKNKKLDTLTPRGGSFGWFAPSPDGKFLGWLFSGAGTPPAHVIAPQTPPEYYYETPAAPPQTPGAMQLDAMQLDASTQQGSGELWNRFLRGFSFAPDGGALEHSANWTPDNELLWSARPEVADQKADAPYASTYRASPLVPGEAISKRTRILENGWNVTPSPDGKSLAHFGFESGLSYKPGFIAEQYQLPYGTTLFVTPPESSTAPSSTAPSSTTPATSRAIGRVHFKYPDVFWLSENRILTCNWWSWNKDALSTARLDLEIWNAQTGRREKIIALRAPAIDRKLSGYDPSIAASFERDRFQALGLSTDGKYLMMMYELHSPRRNTIEANKSLASSAAVFYAVDLESGAAIPMALIRDARGFAWTNLATR